MAALVKNYTGNYLVTFLHHSLVYSYIIESKDLKKAISILTVNIGPFLKKVETFEPVTHTLVNEEGVYTLLSVRQLEINPVL